MGQQAFNKIVGQSSVTLYSGIKMHADAIETGIKRTKNCKSTGNAAQKCVLRSYPWICCIWWSKAWKLSIHELKCTVGSR